MDPEAVAMTAFHKTAPNHMGLPVLEAGPARGKTAVPTVHNPLDSDVIVLVEEAEAAGPLALEAVVFAAEQLAEAAR